MMHATHVNELLSPYIDGQLSPAERMRVTEHLRSCEDCQHHLESLRKTVTLVQASKPIRAPEGLRGQVRARIEEASSQRRVLFRLPQVRWSWRAAGAVAAAVLIGVFSFNLLRDLVPSRMAGVRERDSTLNVGVAPPLTTDRGAAEAPAQQAEESSRRAGDGTTFPSLRRVIRNAQLSIEAEDFDSAARRLLGIAERAGGFIADSSYAEAGGTPYGTFALRVPAGRFHAVVDDVEGIGTVLQRRISGQDVTEQFVDLQARVRNLERHEQRLLSFIDRASKVSDLLAIEQELARVRGEIEQLTGRLRFLDHHVDLATIEVMLREKAKKASGAIWDFGSTLGRMRAAFVATIQQILGAIEKVAVVASALLPVLALAAGAWLLIRRLRMRTTG